MLTYSNSKLANSDQGYLIAVWNLPAGKTCPGAGECKKFCYAQKGNYARFRLNEKAYAKNLMAAESADFVPLMQLSIEAGARKAARQGLKFAVRIHSAGDFYSPRYLNLWIDLARANSNVIFYAYTKSAFAWRAKNLPENMIIIQSKGSLYDGLIDESRPHAKIFDSTEALLAAGYVDASKNDIVATKNIKIGLVKH